MLTHPLVVQELACGHLSRRAEVLSLVGGLPEAPLAAHFEVLELIEKARLDGAGIGAIDAHLLAAARLGRASLWTKARSLARAAARLGVGYQS